MTMVTTKQISRRKWEYLKDGEISHIKDFGIFPEKNGKMLKILSKVVF